jgi:hypothetical protein
LVNYHGKTFSVAELLAYGYATLLRNGGRMSSNFNIGQYLHPGACLYSTLIIYFFSLFSFYNIAFVRGMPKFNPRTRLFMAPVRSSYQSHFKPECQPKQDANKDDKRPSSSNNQNLDESPEEENDYYNKARQQQRPYYPRKHPPSLFIKRLES